MTDDHAERTRLMTWRVALLSLAILVSGGVAPLLVNAGGRGIPGHRVMGACVAVLIAAGAVGVFLGTRGASPGGQTEAEPSLRAQLRVVAGNRPFRLLLVCFIVQAAGIATMLAGVDYFAEQVMRSQAAKTLLFVCFVGPALLVMPVWVRVGARLGKLRAFVAASALFAAGCLAAAAVPLPPTGYVLAAVVGAGYAGQQVFGLAMMPDCAALEAARTGRRQAGVFTGLWTAGETLGLALGPALFGLVLQASGYVSTSGDTPVIQDAGARLGIRLGFTVLPAVVMLIGLVPLRGYDLGPVPAAPSRMEPAESS